MHSSDQNTNKVLFVVYDFPPEGARGTKRTTKFIHYLPLNHWVPIVLTVRSKNRVSHDDSLMAELPPNLQVYRTYTLENLFSWHRNESISTKKVGSQVVTKEHFSFLAPLRKTLKWFYRGFGKILKFPDSRLLWMPFAVCKGLLVSRKHNIRAIYTSGPSHTNHLVGALISRLTRRPLVIDFRDAWVGDPAAHRNNRWIKGGNAALEKFCVKSSTYVVSTTDGIREDFKMRYSGLHTQFITITNGFDTKDFTANEFSIHKKRYGDSKMKIVHAGTLGGERSPKGFLVAIGDLIKKAPELKKQLEIIFVGQSNNFLDGCCIEDYLNEYNCGSVVKITGHVSRKESFDYMFNADLLLLIIGQVPKDGAFRYGISGKLYDYAAAKKPVLTISEPGSSAQLAERLNLGYVVDPKETNQIKSVLIQMIDQHRAGSIFYKPNLELLQDFDFTSLAAKLAKCFDSVVEKNER